jgi:hypothetical protein
MGLKKMWFHIATASFGTQQWQPHSSRIFTCEWPPASACRTTGFVTPPVRFYHRRVDFAPFLYFKSNKGLTNRLKIQFFFILPMKRQYGH